MTSLEADRHRHYSDRRRQDRRDYLAILAVSYPLFLVGAVARRLVPGTARTPIGRERLSVFAEAHRSAASAIPFALR